MQLKLVRSQRPRINAQKTMALALRGTGSIRTVAAQTGLAFETVRRLWKKEDLLPPAVESVKNNLRAKFYLISNFALDSITPEKFEKLDPYRAMLTAGISLDKARLIEGLSTENINFKSLSVTINAELNTLREKKDELLRALNGNGPA